MIDEKFTFVDKNGNSYVCKGGRITLSLKEVPGERQIGRVYKHKNGMTIYEKGEKEKDVFRKWNAWSIPVEIFEKVDGIHFTSETTSYKITTSKAKANMGYLHFRKSGYELKVYIPKHFWHQSEK